MTKVDLYCANVEENEQGASIRTDADDAKEFLEAFVGAICSRFNIPGGQGQGETLRKWVGQAFDIHAKLRGYKSEKVYEKRIMWSGDIQPSVSWHVGGSGDEVADGVEGQNSVSLQKLSKQWEPIHKLWIEADQPEKEYKYLDLLEAIKPFQNAYDEIVQKNHLTGIFGPDGAYNQLMMDLYTVKHEGIHPRSGESFFEDDGQPSIRIQLLSDIRQIFSDKEIERISTVDLIEALCADKERPWLTFDQGGKITAKQISYKLRRFGIKSKSLRINDSVVKGYERQDFYE